MWGNYLSYKRNPKTNLQHQCLQGCQIPEGWHQDSSGRVGDNHYNKLALFEGNTGGGGDRNACWTWSGKTWLCCCPGASHSATVSCYHSIAMLSCWVSPQLPERYKQAPLGCYRLFSLHTAAFLPGCLSKRGVCQDLVRSSMKKKIYI